MNSCLTPFVSDECLLTTMARFIAGDATESALERVVRALVDRERDQGRSDVEILVHGKELASIASACARDEIAADPTAADRDLILRGRTARWLIDEYYASDHKARLCGATRTSCILCGSFEAQRQLPSRDINRLTYSCPECGRYATSRIGQLRWPRATATDYEAARARVREANARGETPFI